MTGKVLPFKRPKQPAFAGIAEAVEADVAELFSPEPTVEHERIGLVAIVSAMKMEAARTGDSVRHLSGGCHIRYSIKGDTRRVVVWRDETTVPSDTELRTLHRDFDIPDWVTWTWERPAALDLAIFRWSTGETEPTGQVYEDRKTIADVRARVEAGEFRAARAMYGRIHGRLQQLAVLDLIIAAEDKAKEAANATL